MAKTIANVSVSTDNFDAWVTKTNQALTFITSEAISANAGTGSTSCATCGANTYSAAAAVACIGCPLNSYSGTGASTCICNAGYSSGGSSGTGLSCVIICPSGYYSAAGSSSW